MKKEQLPSSVIDDARATDLVMLVESYGIKMNKQGKDYFACCPFHTEDTPSFTVYRKDHVQRYHCHGCGADGDAIQFVQDYEGLRFRDAVGRLVGTLPSTGNSPKPAAAREPEEPEEVWTPIMPAPESAPMTPDTIRRKIKGQWVAVKASRRWDYRDANGDVLGYVFRFDMPGGGKEVLPMVWAASSTTGEMQWRWMSFPKPRPMYGLDRLAENPDAQVLLVEGEKAADAAQDLFLSLGVPMSKLVVVSWPGGGKAVKHADFTPLAGRAVALWPDADQKPYPDNHERAGVIMPFLEQPGTVAMLDVWRTIREAASRVKLILPPEGVPDGWDLADPPPSGFSLISHIKSSSVDPVTLVQDNEPAEPVRPAEQAKIDPPPPKPDVLGDDADDGEDVQSDGYFSILGYNRGTYFIFQQESRQIHEYTKADLTDIGFVALAPIRWWEMQPQFMNENGFSKKKAADWLIRRARSRGIYDPSRTRGRGAWIDQGRVVLHLGNTLYVDGVKTDVTKIASRYVYELDRSFPDLSPTRLSNEDGMWLLDVAKKFRWNRPASAPLLAGWVALAPLCGALKWRSHIWVTGGAGSGKTSIMNEYVHALTGEIALFAQGNSTEAGIRQTLRTDARPVLFDESESNDDKERLRIQNVLSMVRQASSESAALTLKGTAHGSSLNFHVRSMFALSSIQVALKHQADMERMAVLSLRPKKTGEDSSEQWQSIKAEFAKIRNDETLSARLFRRSVDLLPVTMQNIATFTRAAAEKFGNQRDGDQYGTLMAGAWSLQSDGLATAKQAREMLDAYEWGDHMEHAESDESQMALGALMGAMVSLQGGAKCTVHELVLLACSRVVPGAPDIGSSDAGAALKRLGLKIEGSELLISNRMLPPLEDIMRHSQFAADMRGQLLRLPGARRYPKVIRFVGVLDRGYAIPLQPLLDESVPSSDPPPAPF